MANLETPGAQIFLPSGKLNLDVLTPTAATAIKESLRFARETRWESVRSPHIFMGLLAASDPGVCNWAERLGADLPRLLDQFQELFEQEEGEEDHCLFLSREYFSDNAIRLLRESYQRARDHKRCQISSMDLLINLLTATNSIVAECFERIGVTAAKLTELAVMAEHHSRPA